MEFDPRNLLMIPVYLFSLTLHEFAHAWSARLGGDDTSTYQGRLTLHPMAHIDIMGTIIFPLIAMLYGIPLIGWAKPVEINTMRFRNSRWLVWVSIAGPLSNLLLVVVSALLLKSFLLGASVGVQNSSAGEAIILLGLHFIGVNLMLAIFNMMPLPPLDGSKIVYHFFIQSRWHLHRTWAMLEQNGMWLLYAVILLPPLRDGLRALYMAPMRPIYSWLFA